jgi:hypothetical protein
VDFSEEGKAGFNFDPSSRVSTTVEPWQGSALEVGIPPRVYVRKVATYEKQLYQILLDGKPFAVFDWEGIGTNASILPQVRVYHLDGSEWLGGTAAQYPLNVGGFDGAGIRLVSVAESVAIFEVYSGHPLQVREISGFEKLPMEVSLVSRGLTSGETAMITAKLPANTRNYDVVVTGGTYDTSFGVNGIVKGLPDENGYVAVQFRPLGSGRYKVVVIAYAVDGRHEGQVLVDVSPPWYMNPAVYAVSALMVFLFVMFGPSPFGFLRRRQKPLPIPEVIRPTALWRV